MGGGRVDASCSSRPARGYPRGRNKENKRKTKVFTILPRASALYFIRYHEQVTKHRQTQLDRRWGAAPRPLKRGLADLHLVDLVELVDLGAELEAAGVYEEYGGSVPAGRGLGLELWLWLGLGLG